MCNVHCQECDGMNRCCEQQRETNEKKKCQIQEMQLEATGAQTSPGFISSGQLYIVSCFANHFYYYYIQEVGQLNSQLDVIHICNSVLIIFHNPFNRETQYSNELEVRGMSIACRFASPNCSVLEKCGQNAAKGCQVRFLIRLLSCSAGSRCILHRSVVGQWCGGGVCW